MADSSVTVAPISSSDDSAELLTINAFDRLNSSVQSVEFAISDEEGLILGGQNSRPRVERSSKRANSSTSVSNRNKFRSKFDLFSPFKGSINNSTGDSAGIEIKKNDKTGRHDSESSVLEDPLEKDITSPLDYFYSNKTLHPSFPIKLIHQPQYKAIINWHYSNRLPECDEVFPWLHGIQYSSNSQRDFLNTLMSFTTVEKNNYEFFHNKIPSSSRGLMPVRSSPVFSPEEIHPSSAILKGTVIPQHILAPLDVSSEYLLIFLNNFLKDLKVPKEDFENVLNTLHSDCTKTKLYPLFQSYQLKGISLRNFHIQVSKVAEISDFIVYCFNDTHLHHDGSLGCHCESISRLLYFAQLKHSIDHPELVDSLYSTFLLQDNDISFFKLNRKLLAMDILTLSDSISEPGSFCSKFDIEVFKNWDMDYLLREKLEIAKMSSATQVFENLWLGNTMDYEILKLKGYKEATLLKRQIPQYIDPSNSTVIIKDLEDEALLINTPKQNWRSFVYCSDIGSFPKLTKLSELLQNPDEELYWDFPASGSIDISRLGHLPSIINLCKVLYTRNHHFLIHCSDGYTDSSLLAVLYLIYSTGRSATEVIMDLHKQYGRPVFLFPIDSTLIYRVEPIFLHYSPLNLKKYDPTTLEQADLTIQPSEDPGWFHYLQGSLPSRILSHLYLGSLEHAHSFELLENLGITKVVSVGENLAWLNDYNYDSKTVNSNITNLSNFSSELPINEVLCITNCQDDGIDALTNNLNDILNFIDACYKSGEKVLVHCRVGVSRSATVCIAEVMKRLKINLIKAYIYVRVRRLNIIIQPNLRFMYELVKWEESQRLNKLKKTLKAKVNSLSNSPLDSSTVSQKPFMAVELSKRLSASISSLVSDVSDTVTEKFATSPLISASERLGPELAEESESDAGKNSDSDDSDNEVEDDEEAEYWLRDVDWHVLCREIHNLNRAYIRG